MTKAFVRLLTKIIVVVSVGKVHFLHELVQVHPTSSVHSSYFTILNYKLTVPKNELVHSFFF